MTTLPMTLDEARALDAADALTTLRDEFLFPDTIDGRPAIYLCGNSLGLQPRGVGASLQAELEDWGRLGVEAHFHGRSPWYDYHEFLRDSMAAIVGALPHEVVVMNALTVNLHLMMVSFYRPTATRYKILVEGGAFPSDQYAVASQAAFHGFDPKDAIIELVPRAGEHTLRMEDVEAVIAARGEEIALIMIGGVHYYTGQAMDLGRITRAGHAQGCVVGFDLAHAAGNLALRLHEDGPDFAVWCTYKYLNGGPGGVAGCFVHERHAEAPALPRFAGWWGNDPKRRFEMAETFAPQRGAAGWQLSNAPVLSMAALRPSLALFERAGGMSALRERSERLTGTLLELIDALPDERFEIITPRDAASRGCQLSIRARQDARALFDRLQEAGIICDYRKPDVVRVAPAPLYNTFEDVWRFAEVLASVV